ncbi:amidohydrolase (plasmid) [Gemmatirosa kalamazoonensis]|uniref:Amidohydrolase n=1 Tax=Gemmatirosa kalamazoonensis TaxID=861299 RepID=W0RNR7_9BACT|nr:amidohydrolase family protein [Gemmatirosa kalamazoonensis]AHG92381.1 amidohydrolase [Gemmatirosa kalamazoonensis]
MRLYLSLLLAVAPLGAQPKKPNTVIPDTATQRINAEERRTDPKYAPDRHEGDGPYARLVIRGATLIDGTGGPPRGPVDIVVENDRIAEVRDVGVPRVRVDSARRPRGGAREIDATGMYVMPGIVDLHVHQGTPQKAPESEYYNKLWLGHGITTVRGVPFSSFEYGVHEKQRSAANAIAAPRYVVYQRPGTGWGRGPVKTPDEAREWVRWIASHGADGLKLGAERPDLMAALLDEARKLGLGSVAHLQQTGVAQMNADEATRLGLGTVTHFYGLFESMYDSATVQPWPVTMNYNDEQDRFGQVARQWQLVTPRSEKWNAFLKRLKERDVTLDPTFSIYLTGRDVIHHMYAPWHDKYTLPSLYAYYAPSRTNHGSYWYDWTTADEVAWRNFYHVWMEFVHDYKNMGGRVTTGSDAGFIYSTPGFATIEEMELLQEAGFHPLEVVRSATMYGAETLAKPSGKPIEFGVVRPGMLADLAIVDQNPLQNLKVLYGIGALRLNDATGQPERVGGVRWTIKDGIVYDARQLLADVARMVETQKQQRAANPKAAAAQDARRDEPWEP